MKALNTFYISAISSLKTLALFILSGLLLGSCQKSDGDVLEPISAVNIVNTAIGMPQVAFSINKIQVQGAPLNYTDESGYFITFAGTQDFDVSAGGITDYILKTSFNFKQNTYHTIFITGEGTNISALFTEDDLTNPPAGKAKLRFVHLSPDAGSLVLSLKNSTALFSEQSYKTASAYISIDPGIYDLQLKTATGTIITEQNVTVTAGDIYNVWAKGMKAGIQGASLGLEFRAVN